MTEFFNDAFISISIAALTALSFVWLAFLAIKDCGRIWRYGNSIVAYNNDVALYDGVSRVNVCNECRTVYSDYVRFSSYPCPKCSSVEKKKSKFAYLNVKKLSFFKKTYYWRVIDETI